MNFLNQYISNLRPHVRTAARVTQLFTTSVLRQLDTIARRLEDYGYNRPLVRPHSLTAGEVVSFTVPAGEEWRLHHVALTEGAGGNSTVTIRVNGILRYRTATDFGFVNGTDTLPAIGLYIGPASVVELLSADEDVEATLEFMVRETDHARPASGAGQSAPTGLSGNQVATEIERHLTPEVMQ